MGDAGLERWEDAEGMDMNGFVVSNTLDFVFFTARFFTGEPSLIEMPLKPARMEGVNGVFASDRALLRLGVFGMCDMTVQDRINQVEVKSE